MRRIETVDAFASLEPNDWPRAAVEACRLAIRASAIDDERMLAALRAAEQTEDDPETAADMRSLAARLDEDASDARDAGEGKRYDDLFRRSRAASALAFALSGEPDEALYEAAYAVGTPEDLLRQLPS